MKKRYIHLVMMLAALAGIIACGHDDPEQLSKEDQERLETVNTFAYNVMNTYYLWNEEIADSLATWKQLERDPIEKVKRIRYKDSKGKDIDKWTVLTEDIESMISSTAGVSTTYGMDFKVYWYDASQTNVCLVVTLTYPDSPAEQAGLKRGDVIMKIAGKEMTEKNYSTLIYDSFLYAKSCSLTDVNGKEYRMTAVEMYEEPVLVRKVFNVDGKKVGYLFYNSFTLASCDKLIDAGRYFRSEGIESLILDLRYNGGGYVITELVLASLLAPESEVKAGSVFEKTIYNKLVSNAWKDETACFSENISAKINGKQYDFDLTGANCGISHLYAIMTNGSASASESLLVGLKPYLDTKIFGEQSYGKYCSGIMYSAKEWYEDYDEVLESKQRELGQKYAEKWGIYVMIGRFADKYGNTPCMPDGFTPDYPVEDNPVAPYQLGDQREPMLAAVLERLGGKAGAAGRAAAPAAPVRALGPEIPQPRDPASYAQILLPQGRL